MKTKSLLPALALLVLCSCSTARYAPWFTPSSSVSERTVLLGPVSEIIYLDNKNRSSLSDSLSFASEALVEQLAYGLPLNIVGSVALDSLQRREAIALLREVEKWGDVEMQTRSIPAALDTLIEAGGDRYGLLLYTDGLMRDPRGYAKAVATAAVAGLASVLLSGGALVYTASPTHAAAHIHAVLLDAQDNRVVFFNRDTRDEEISPLNDQMVNRQLQRLFKGYLKKK